MIKAIMKYQSPLMEKYYKGNDDDDGENDDDDEENNDDDEDNDDDEENDEGLWLFDRPFHLWCIN